MTQAMLEVRGLKKTFGEHTVLDGVDLQVNQGEVVAIIGPSGTGKSTLLRSLYANYLPDEGHIHIRHNNEWVDLVQAPARKVLEVRRSTIG